MREIKFRGKVADEPDEWVYGYLVYKYIIYQPLEHKNSKCCGVGNFTVKEETVSQYTGLKDKNGVEIYEGDIVQGRIKDEGIDIQGIVVYCECGYYFVKDKDDQCMIYIISDLEVIGNIYENAELLEVENE